MAFKNSILLGTIGGYHDRFHVYQKPRTLEERLDLALKIPRADGVEPVYPQDLGHDGGGVDLVKKSGLGVSAVNVNIKTEEQFVKGSFTSRDAKVRDKALNYIKTAMDLSADLGSNMVSVCPLIDGWDYPFEVDYQDQWRQMVDTFEKAAAHRSDVKISIEYKAFESRNRIILPNLARTLVLCEKIGAPNLGITMDVGHALMADETPAAEAALGQEFNRLFYVHFNDNDRRADWDMLPASVNLWETLELLYYLDRMDWNGWFAYDVFTRNGDNVEAVAATFEIMDNLEKLRHKISKEELDAMIADGTPAHNINKLIASLL